MAVFITKARWQMMLGGKQIPIWVCCIGEHCPSSVGLLWCDLGHQKCKKLHVFLQCIFKMALMHAGLLGVWFLTFKRCFYILCSCICVIWEPLIQFIVFLHRGRFSSICLWQCAAGLRPETMSYSISTWKSLAGVHHITSVSARLDIIHTSTEAYTCLRELGLRPLINV